MWIREGKKFGSGINIPDPHNTAKYKTKKTGAMDRVWDFCQIRIQRLSIKFGSASGLRIRVILNLVKKKVAVRNKAAPESSVGDPSRFGEDPELRICTSD